MTTPLVETPTGPGARYHRPMGVLRDGYEISVDGCPVRLTGRSGRIFTTWELHEGDRLLEKDKAPSGSFDLSGRLSSGTEVIVTIDQTGLGPTRVTIEADDETLADLDGFVL